jgi:hypothetical protein
VTGNAAYRKHETNGPKKEEVVLPDPFKRPAKPLYFIHLQHNHKNVCKFGRLKAGAKCFVEIANETR